MCTEIALDKLKSVGTFIVECEDDGVVRNTILANYSGCGVWDLTVIQNNQTVASRKYALCYSTRTGLIPSDNEYDAPDYCDMRDEDMPLFKWTHDQMRKADKGE